MKRFTISIAFSLLFLLPVSLQAQQDSCVVDSLEIVTVSGTVIASEDTARNQIFLDVDADGTADYKLNFGPPWYEPVESEAVRPSNGDEVTVTGGLAVNEDFEEFEVLLVYEINGEFWRDPAQPFWNNPGGMQHKGGKKGKNNKWQKGLRYDSLSLESVTGTVQFETAQLSDYILVTVEDDITSVESGVAAPAEYALAQNYPNPFNPSTTITFTLAETSDVTLKVYNILGQQVASVINATLPAGTHSVQFDASALAAGMYLYQIQAADFNATRKMILLK